MIRARNLAVTRSGRPILGSITLDLPTAQVTAVIGPSGAGKTTLLRCLALVQDADEGELQIGATVYSFPRAEARKGISTPWPFLTAVFQELWLWDHLDLETNIRLPNQANRDPAADARFSALVEDLDLGGLVDRYPHQVSGGERQRAAIARALMQQPSILLLDEPTSASDVEHSHALAGLIRRLAHDKGMTVVLVTHHLRFAELVSDRVVFLDRGAILQSGPTALLKTSDDERVRRFVSVL